MRGNCVGPSFSTPIIGSACVILVGAVADAQCLEGRRVVVVAIMVVAVRETAGTYAANAIIVTVYASQIGVASRVAGPGGLRGAGITVVEP